MTDCGVTAHRTPKSGMRDLPSASWWLVASPALACLTVARPTVWRGLPRPALRDPTVDSPALRPVEREAGDGVGGPRNDSPVPSPRAARLRMTVLAWGLAMERRGQGARG